MVDLTHWADGEGPTTYDLPFRLRLTKFTRTFRAPGKGGKITGHTGIDPKRGRAYLTVRSHAKHYYRKGGGYAISASILGKLQYHDVEAIAIYETDNRTTHVFIPEDYYSGEQVNPRYTPTDEPQHYTPVGDAIERFDNPEPPITDLRK